MWLVLRQTSLALDNEAETEGRQRVKMEMEIHIFKKHPTMFVRKRVRYLMKEKGRDKRQAHGAKVLI